MHEGQISKKLYFFNIFLLFAVIFMSFAVYQRSVVSKKVVKVEQIEKNLVAFNTITVKAKSAFVYDLVERRVLYAKNENEQLPLASITKLMTALVATELLPKDTQITIKSDFLKEEGNSGLRTDESWTLKDLLDFSLVTSSNDGARSLASVIGAVTLNTNDYDLGRKEFIEKMNSRARDLGLERSFFVNETGLDVDNVSGGYGSSKDVTELMEYIVVNYPEILEATKYHNLDFASKNFTHEAENTNDSVGMVPGLFASKTGFTELAGGNLTIAFDPSLGRPIIVTVLGSTLNGRFEDVNLLVQKTLEYLNQ